MARYKSIGGLVYSTELGRMCPACRQALADCQCKAQTRPQSGDGVVRLRCETKGRKGKGVTVITGVPLDAARLAVFAQSLRQRVASGGAVKDGRIEIQGDHVASLLPLLQQQGWIVKTAGG